MDILSSRRPLDECNTKNIAIWAYTSSSSLLLSMVRGTWWRSEKTKLLIMFPKRSIYLDHYWILLENNGSYRPQFNIPLSLLGKLYHFYCLQVYIWCYPCLCLYYLFSLWHFLMKFYIHPSESYTKALLLFLSWQLCQHA